MNKLNTYQFAKIFISRINSEVFEKKYINCDFDFMFTKVDLPYDFDEKKFEEYFREYFEITSFHLDELDGCYRCYGHIVTSIEFKHTFSGEINLIPEDIKKLKELAKVEIKEVDSSLFDSYVVFKKDK